MTAQSDWTEVSLRVRPEAAEAVADLLQALTGAGVAIEPPIQALGPDEGYTLDVEAPLVLRGYVYGPVSSARRDGVRRRLRAAGLDGSLVGTLRWRVIREEDWAEAWKAHYDIERVGRVVVRPAWREYDPTGDEVVVSLDPGMAFGTGQHPTTRMCLQLVQELLQPGDAVLDLGTGSGILGIAALRLGASRCVAVDVEEQAVKAAVANVALNGLEKQMSVSLGSLAAVAAQGPFDLVLANINASTVIALAQGIHDVLRPGRSMAGGGIIEPRLGEVLAAVESAGFEVQRVLEDGDWRTLVAVTGNR
jgi:ribosomal protein L11 methyltransferase